MAKGKISNEVLKQLEEFINLADNMKDEFGKKVELLKLLQGAALIRILEDIGDDIARIRERTRI